MSTKRFYDLGQAKCRLDHFIMEAKTKKTKAEVPFDPVLFAGTVPGRKPTPKDLADAKECDGDAIEPRDCDSMEDMVEDL